MKTFHEAEQQFLEWIRKNPNGFIISCRSDNDMMLHRPSCHHFNFSEPVKLTAHQKMCSSDKSELERWASKESKILKYCRTCSP
jgi:hypothetical protein